MRYTAERTNGPNKGVKLRDAIAPNIESAADHIARRYGRRCYAYRATGHGGMSGVFAVYEWVDSGGLGASSHTGIEFHISEA